MLLSVVHSCSADSQPAGNPSLGSGRRQVLTQSCPLAPLPGGVDVAQTELWGLCGSSSELQLSIGTEHGGDKEGNAALPSQ